MSAQGGNYYKKAAAEDSAEAYYPVLLGIVYIYVDILI